MVTKIVGVEMEPFAPDHESRDPVEDADVPPESMDNVLEVVKVENPDVWSSKSDDLEEDETDGPVATEAQSNIYIVARVHVQRVIDVTLLINNMSRLSTVFQRHRLYSPLQLQLMVFALVVSMIAQIIAGTCFFISHHRELNKLKPRPSLDYMGYAGVALVTVLNIFISTFDTSWVGDGAAIDTEAERTGLT